MVGADATAVTVSEPKTVILAALVRRGDMIVVAAAGAGIMRVMLPARNRKDFLDIPDEVREGTSFIWLETVDDAVTAALESEANALEPAPAGATGT